MENIASYTATEVRPKTQNVISNNLEIFSFIAEIYEAMGDQGRLKILYVVDREKSVNYDEICRILRTDGINIDKDLKTLVDLKILSCVKFKQQYFYALNTERKDIVLPLLDKVKTHISMKKLYEMEEFALYVRKRE